MNKNIKKSITIFFVAFMFLFLIPIFVFGNEISWPKIFSLTEQVWKETNIKRPALILSILEKETNYSSNLGSNTGLREKNIQRCVDMCKSYNCTVLNQNTDGHRCLFKKCAPFNQEQKERKTWCTLQQDTLEKVCKEAQGLDKTALEVPIAQDYGMGSAQFQPTTWILYPKLKNKNPWELEDAIFAAGYKLVGDKVDSNEIGAIRKYNSGPKYAENVVDFSKYWDSILEEVSKTYNCKSLNDYSCSLEYLQEISKGCENKTCIESRVLKTKQNKMKELKKQIENLKTQIEELQNKIREFTQQAQVSKPSEELTKKQKTEPSQEIKSSLEKEFREQVPEQIPANLWKFAKQIDQALSKKDVDFFIENTIFQNNDNDFENGKLKAKVSDGFSLEFLSIDDYKKKIQEIFNKAKSESEDELGNGNLQLHGIILNWRGSQKSCLHFTYIESFIYREDINENVAFRPSIFLSLQQKDGKWKIELLQEGLGGVAGYQDCILELGRECKSNGEYIKKILSTSPDYIKWPGFLGPKNTQTKIKEEFKKENFKIFYYEDDSAKYFAEYPTEWFFEKEESLGFKKYIEEQTKDKAEVILISKLDEAFINITVSLRIPYGGDTKADLRCAIIPAESPCSQFPSETVKYIIKNVEGKGIEEVKNRIGTSQILEEKITSNEHFIEAILDPQGKDCDSTGSEIIGHVWLKTIRGENKKYLTIQIGVPQEKWIDYQDIAESVINSAKIEKK